MGDVKVQGHIVGPPWGIATLPFQVNWPSHSWDTATCMSKFDFENPWSKSSHCDNKTHSGPINVLYIIIFKINKIKPNSSSEQQSLQVFMVTESHSSRSYSGSNFLVTHILFVSCQSILPFLSEIHFSKIWPWKSKVKVNWPWKSKPKVKSFSSYIISQYWLRSWLGPDSTKSLLPEPLETIMIKIYGMSSNFTGLRWVNSLWPTDAIWHQRSWSILVPQVPDGTKPLRLPEPMLIYHKWDPLALIPS